MFDLELVRAWTLRIDRMARPERSGVIANLIVYGLLWSAGMYAIPHDYGDTFNLRCYLMPWECPKAPEYREEEIQKRYHVVMLYEGVGQKKYCTCHLDLHYFGRPVTHIHPSLEEACDSDSAQPRTWTAITDYCSTKILGPMEHCSDAIFTYQQKGLYVQLSVRAGEAEWRFHCDKRGTSQTERAVSLD